MWKVKNKFRIFFLLFINKGTFHLISNCIETIFYLDLIPKIFINTLNS